ncbi:MAG TPA: LLM class flavin-dependent oxidoreductase, partial [Chloroflexota bacterium]|nr:LLM class flavin-dependent oxidoreductase [Chloroflexota bacterium]
GLDVITGLWRGQPFRYDGKHYHIQPTTFFPPPPPVQSPRIPIWVVGAWPHEKSMRRALQYDGLLPAAVGRQLEPGDVRQMADYVAANRTASTSFDIVAEGKTPIGDRSQDADILGPWVESGATWWIEARWDEPANATLRRLRDGPPRLF